KQCWFGVKNKHLIYSRFSCFDSTHNKACSKVLFVMEHPPALVGEGCGVPECSFPEPRGRAGEARGKARADGDSPEAPPVARRGLRETRGGDALGRRLTFRAFSSNC